MSTVEPFDRAKLRAELSRDEGRKRSVYRDSLGFYTIGVGHLVDARRGGGLPEPIIDALLEWDIDTAYDGVKDEPWFIACDTDNRRRAVLNMYFELGPKLRGFVNTLQSMVEQDWAMVGKRLRKSLWYRQVPERAERVVRMLEQG
jgi:lysozyme